MNWGLRIVILYGGFVALILTLVFKATGEKIDLVTKDYYEQELLHQGKMDALQRGYSWKKSMDVRLQSNLLSITFPKEFPSFEQGTITVYRPSDASQDKSFPLLLNNEFQQILDVKTWQSGYYALHISWTTKEEKYYVEETIFIP